MFLALLSGSCLDRSKTMQTAQFRSKTVSLKDDADSAVSSGSLKDDADSAVSSFQAYDSFSVDAVGEQGE